MSTCMRAAAAAPLELRAARARLLLARGTDRLDWSLVADFVEVPWPASLVALENGLGQVATEEGQARSRHLRNPLAGPAAMPPLAHAWLVEDAVFTALCPAWRASMDPLSEQAHETRRFALVTLQAHVLPLSIRLEGRLDELALEVATALGAMEDHGTTQGARLTQVAARLKARQQHALSARTRAGAGAPMTEAAA
jgi:hypothetical protein